MFDAYARHTLVPTIVHIGPGVFHRAHQAVYCDDLLRAGAVDASIRAVSLRSPTLRDAIGDADFVYHVVEVDDSGDAGRVDTVRRVGSIVGVDVVAEDVGVVLARLADPSVTVVTITVTEHGYCAVSPGGPLDVERDEIVHDLATPDAPRSLPGLLVEALARRRAAGTDPFTVVSCDNLPANGRAVARVVSEFAACRDPHLSAWIDGNVAFPSSMVDRMVPTTTDTELARCRALGVDDRWPIVTEPFSQWVLEDTFTGARPDWGSVGVEIVGDVARHEQAKLRILNAAHSALAYWGLLAGHEYVWQAVTDPVLADATVELLEREVIPTLGRPPGWDLRQYADEVLRRFANRALPYTTAKVAGDGSQKLPVRLMPTVRDLVASGRRAPRAAQLVAAWATVMAGPQAPRCAISDPALSHGRAGAIVARARQERVDASSVVAALIALPGFELPDVHASRVFATTVVAEARRLWQDDVHAVLARPLDSLDPDVAAP